MQTILQQIINNSISSPAKVALISDGEQVSYADLVSNINKASACLHALGVQKGDRIMLSAHKELRFVYCYFATHLLGAVSVVVDSESKQTRINYIKDKVNPRYVLGNFAESIKYEDLQLEDANNEFDTLAANIDVNAPCDILFTTGTTGNPKGVVLSSYNELSAVKNINEFIQNTSEDIELLALPLCHSFGLGRLRCVLSKGATLILQGSFANLKVVLDTIEEYGVTGFGMVPSVWNYIRKFSGKRIGMYGSQIKYIEIGSAAMAIEDKELLMELFPNARICMHYGLTEASRSAFIEFHSSKAKLDSIGTASPNVEIKIFDESGSECACGEEGELCVKGGHVMSGYYDSSDNVNAFFGDYFRTGDWGIEDEDGWVYLRGRKKEIINVGGKKVSPLEVEGFLSNMRGAAECACVGIKDPAGILGEVVKAYIVPKVKGTTITSKEVFKFLLDKVETYKIPVIVEMIENLPKTESGKLQRLKLK